MTQPPPPLEPFPIEPSPPSRWTGIAAWIVIWATVLYLMAGTMLPKLRGKAAPVGTSDAQIELVGKYVVGAAHLTRGAATQPSVASGAVLVEQLDPLVHSDRNRLQAATIAGEVMGADAAQQRLKAIEPSGLTDAQRRALETLAQIYTAGGAAVAADDAQQLESELGYFGRLALSFNRPPDDPLRRSIISHSKKVAAIFGAAIVGGGIGLVVGLVLLILGLALLATGVMHWHYTPQARTHSVFVEMFAVYLLSFLLLSLVLSLVYGGAPPLAVSWLLSVVLPIAIGWGLWRGVPWNELRHGLGWHGGRGWYIEIPCGIVGYIAGLPIVGVGFLITLALIRLSGETPSHPIQGESVRSTLEALQLYGIASLWAPILEETMFRGALFHHLRQRWGWTISAGIVAFIFAAIHPQGWATIPVLGSIALVLAALREWRGSLLASMTAHACNNFIMVSLLLATR
jgi:membrane protease YdiL (CAAX protease family)